METDCYCSTLRAATRRISALYDEALAPVGVNIAQWGLLRKLENAGSALSIRELADRAELERSTVARNIRILSRDGLVHLDASADDRRVSGITLTTQGAALLAQGSPLWSAAQRRVEEMLDGQDSAVGFRSLVSSLRPGS